jgi:hypothetical protein
MEGSKRKSKVQAPSSMTNAQKQQFSNVQQQVPMQIPVQQLQIPVQQQMQFPVQVNMIQPGVTVQSVPNRVGYYGNRSNPNGPQTPNELPAIFNDDEKFMESVKEVGK